MFYAGDLQSGITHAIQTSKTVACFVTSFSSTEAQTWEHDWLCVESVSAIMETKAVALRIEEGTQEAGFLAAFAPVEGVVPVLVFIRDGRVLDVLKSGIAKEEFVDRVKRVLGPKEEGDEAETKSSAESTTRVEESSTGSTIETAASSAPSETPSSSSASTQILNEERSAQLKAKGKQKQNAASIPSASASSSTTEPPARSDYLEQQRLRKIEARRERERIMAQIEADKAERRARREQDRQARENASSQLQQQKASDNSNGRKSNAKSRSETSNLQVRLLDGSTVRKQFPATATLESDVRPWIDENLGDAAAPYTFKHILAPQPARSISVSEEQQALLELDLTPSATLVLQTIDTYSDAYTATPGGVLSLPYTAVTGAYGLVSETVGSAARWLRGGLYSPPDGNDGMGGQVLGATTSGPPHTGSESLAGNDEDAAAARRRTGGSQRSGGVRVRTLADQRDGSADQQFYNGNSLDFQPRGQ